MSAELLSLSAAGITLLAVIAIIAAESWNMRRFKRRLEGSHAPHH
jgi:hypothetical protein